MARAELRSTTGVAVLTATILASTIGFLDASVVGVAIPAIGSDFRAGVAELQWVVTGYLVTVAALLLVAGGLSDRYGRRRVLVVGLLITLVTSVLCALANSVGLLIAARVLQGAGGALTVPSSLALLNATLRPEDRARGIGLWAGLATLGMAIGPYAGGWLVDNASWQWLFLLNLPLIVAALLVLRRVPESVDLQHDGHLDVVGAILTAVGFGGIIYALTEGSANGWSRTPVVLAGVIGLLSVIVLFPLESRRRAPVIRLRLFQSRQFDAINVSTFLFYAALGGAGYILYLQLELQLGYSATAAGAALIPATIVFLLISPLSGALVARFGPRWPMAIGTALVGIAFLYLTALGPDSTYLTGLLPGNLLQGIGLGIAVTPLTAAVLAAVNDADLGEASAINNTVARIGGVAAIALLPALAGGAGMSLSETISASYRPAMIATALLSFAAAGVAAIFVSRAATVGTPRIAPPPPHGCIADCLTRTLESSR
ncbi:DHA2 family efflux MFS transporter permease subunit [Kribbella sp. NPDC056861]|uniref:DHA2 family efflux MFS transporter permease subunit n=1 Tax=Kribbella sp. NPDC056861 TaxID=3154857 RepID=UPI00342DF5C1